MEKNEVLQNKINLVHELEAKLDSENPEELTALADACIALSDAHLAESDYESAERAVQKAVDCHHIAGRMTIPQHEIEQAEGLLRWYLLERLSGERGHTELCTQAKSFLKIAKGADADLYYILLMVLQLRELRPSLTNFRGEALPAKKKPLKIADDILRGAMQNVEAYMAEHPDKLCEELLQVLQYFTECCLSWNMPDESIKYYNTFLDAVPRFYRRRIDCQIDDFINRIIEVVRKMKNDALMRSFIDATLSRPTLKAFTSVRSPYIERARLLSHEKRYAEAMLDLIRADEMLLDEYDILSFNDLAERSHLLKSMSQLLREMNQPELAHYLYERGEDLHDRLDP